MTMQQFYPELYADYITNPENRNNGTSHRMIPHSLCNKLPTGCAVMIRNPIDRFRSLLWRTGISAELALSRLYWFFGLGTEPQFNNRKDVELMSGDALYHFLPVAMIADEDSKLFLFPDFSGIMDYCGLNSSKIEQINKTPENNSITLGSDMIQKIEVVYKDDIQLYNKLVNR